MGLSSCDLGATWSNESQLFSDITSTQEGELKRTTASYVKCSLWQTVSSWGTSILGQWLRW